LFYFHTVFPWHGRSLFLSHSLFLRMMMYAVIVISSLFHIWLTTIYCSFSLLASTVSLLLCFPLRLLYRSYSIYFIYVYYIAARWTRVLIWYQLGFSLGLPQKWFWLVRCEFGPRNRNPNPKDSTLNNLIGYSLTLAGVSQVCK